MFSQYEAEVPRPTHIINENVISDIQHHSIYQLFETTKEKLLSCSLQGRQVPTVVNYKVINFENQ